MLRHIAQRLIQAFVINNRFLHLLILKVTGDIRPYAKGPLNRRVIGPFLTWFKGPFCRHLCITCHNKKVHSIGSQRLALVNLFP